MTSNNSPASDDRAVVSAQPAQHFPPSRHITAGIVVASMYRNAMASITALLIVFTLTGEPAASALCINWCDANGRQSCDEAIAQPISAAVSAASRTCVALLTVNPFLTEEGRTAVHFPAAVNVVHAFSTLPTQGSDLANIRSDGGALAARSAPTLVLRI